MKRDDTERTLYKCDPKKNTECKKGYACQNLCFMTTRRDFSRDGKPHRYDEESGIYERVDG